MALRRSLEDRFWTKIDQNGPVMPGMSTSCWTWMGAKDTGGYGNFNLGMRFVKAHSFAFTQKNGALPEGKFVLHTCDNPSCCNPAHLYAGTKKDNAQDRERRQRGNHAVGQRHGCVTHPGLHRGERNGRAKMTEDTVRDLRRRHREGERAASLARAYGLTKTTVSGILRGKLWGHVEG